MTEKKRRVILLLAFLLLLRVFTCSIVPESDKEAKHRCEPMSVSEEISENEVNNFLKTWNEYVKKGYDKKVQDKVSLMDGKLEDNLPFSVKLWLSAKCWEPKRFYYVEDRLRSAVRTLYLKKHSASILSILQDKAQGSDASEYQDMIDMQNKIANIENISDEELKFVQMREAEITKILNVQ